MAVVESGAVGMFLRAIEVGSQALVSVETVSKDCVCTASKFSATILMIAIGILLIELLRTKAALSATKKAQGEANEAANENANEAATENANEAVNEDTMSRDA